jgi:hypothetical protein
LYSTVVEKLIKVLDIRITSQAEPPARSLWLAAF